MEEEIIVLAAASFCGFVVIGTFNLNEFQLFSSALTLCRRGHAYIQIKLSVLTREVTNNPSKLREYNFVCQLEKDYYVSQQKRCIIAAKWFDAQ